MTKKSEIAQDQEVIVEKEDIIRVDQIQESADIEGMIVERDIVENTEGHPDQDLTTIDLVLEDKESQGQDHMRKEGMMIVKKDRCHFS
jgi:hypothetical protein